MLIEHDNIIYMSDIPNMGGTSTYVLQLVKKYKDRDIAVVYKTCEIDMIKKIKKYCITYKLSNEDKIKCKVMIINHDSTICDQVLEGKIYMTLHADYSNEIYKGGHPDFRDRIDGYISITKGIQKWLKETCDKDSQVIYNPLQVEDNKPIIIISATRMSNQKGGERTKILAQSLDRAGINYVWYIYTPSNDFINNPNVIFMKPRMDLERFMYMADYVAQLSDSEGLSYTINEALYRNIPVIVTPLPYLDEIGVKDGVNSYIVNFDCSNVDEVAKKIKKIPKFKFEHLDDSYDDIFTKKKSHFAEDMKENIEVECIFDGMQHGFADIETGLFRKFGDRWYVGKIRARELLENPNHLIKIVEKASG